MVGELRARALVRGARLPAARGVRGWKLARRRLRRRAAAGRGARRAFFLLPEETGGTDLNGQGESCQKNFAARAPPPLWTSASAAAPCALSRASPPAAMEALRLAALQEQSAAGDSIRVVVRVRPPNERELSQARCWRGAAPPRRARLEQPRGVWRRHAHPLAPLPG
jgi:hypothetical protein